MDVCFWVIGLVEICFLMLIVDRDSIDDGNLVLLRLPDKSDSGRAGK